MPLPTSESAPRPSLRLVPLLAAVTAACLATASAAAFAASAPGPPAMQGQGQAPMSIGVVEATWAWEPREPVAPPSYVEAPELVTRTVPGHTIDATRAGVQGQVIVEATIDAQGRVVAPRLIRSLADETLNRRALEALEEWRFRPARLGGAPAAVTGIFTFAFVIRSSEPPPATGLRAEALEMGTEGLVPPTVLSRRMPEYTTAAREAGIEGDVYVEAVVTVRGEVAEPLLIRGVGDDELDRRAIAALSSWRFDPGTVDGEPVPVLALFTVTYRIERSR